MPSYKTNQVDEVTGKNVYRNYCYAANKEFSGKVNSLILNRYKETIMRSPISEDKPSINDTLASGEAKKTRV